MWKIEKSQIDKSVNFIKEKDGSFIECRYVRREDSQIVVYLSSHNGCKMACRFCHLTATGQTSMAPVTLLEYLYQATTVLDYWRDNDRHHGETSVNYNFMARGEPLDNSELTYRWSEIEYFLSSFAAMVDVEPSFNISTIVPKNFIGFDPTFNPKNTRIYWSLYSPNSKFRRRWLPKAMDPNKAAQHLNNWREYGGKLVIHNAFIAGENDSPEQIEELVDFLYYHGMQDCDFNIVAYNPYSERHGKESERIPEIATTLRKNLLGRVQIIDRIGVDVHASCGCFHV